VRRKYRQERREELGGTYLGTRFSDEEIRMTDRGRAQAINKNTEGGDTNRPLITPPPPLRP
jgi:hypothetical protein